MAENLRLINAKDTVYTFNGFGALNGIQRFNYSYTANEETLSEIGNANFVDQSVRPETTVSFEVTDTGSLAALLARLRYDYDTQDYVAGTTTDINTNAFSFNEEDLQFVIFTCAEYTAPGGTFTEAKLFPYHFLNSLSISLNSDGAGSVSLEANGALFRPLYQPYHTTVAYPIQRATDTTATIDAGWAVTSGTHNVLAVEYNSNILSSGIAWSGATTLTFSDGTILTDEDRILVWAFERTPSTALPTIDYVNTVKFVKADRINIWLEPLAATTTEQNKFLRVQALDLSVDMAREELTQIARTDTGSSIFYFAPVYPLEITGSVRILETTLDKWAGLQGKTLNPAADPNGAIDWNNVLDISSWEDLKLVIEWYRYGSDSPIQRLLCSGVKITGYDGTQEVSSRKEATWNISTSSFQLEGFDV